MKDMFKKLLGDDAEKIAYYFGVEKAGKQGKKSLKIIKNTTLKTVSHRNLRSFLLKNSVKMVQKPLKTCKKWCFKCIMKGGGYYDIQSGNVC